MPQVAMRGEKKTFELHVNSLFRGIGILPMIERSSMLTVPAVSEAFSLSCAQSWAGSPCHGAG
jgi:hypothetical protein